MHCKALTLTVMKNANNISPLIDIFTITFDRIAGAGSYGYIYTIDMPEYWIGLGLY